MAKAKVQKKASKPKAQAKPPKASPKVAKPKAKEPVAKLKQPRPKREPELKLARVSPSQATEAAFETGEDTLPASLIERRAPVSGESATSRGKYVYCIIRADQFLSFGPIGMGSNPSDVTTVNYRWWCSTPPERTCSPTSG